MMEVVSRLKIRFGENAEFYVESHISDSSRTKNIELDAGNYLVWSYFAAWGSNGIYLSSSYYSVVYDGKTVTDSGDAPRCISLTKKTVVTFKGWNTTGSKNNLWMYFYKKI